MKKIKALIKAVSIHWFRKISKSFLKDEFESYMKEVLSEILPTHYLVFGCDKSRLSISKSAVVNNALFNVNSGEITIEDYVFFGHNVSVITGTHNYEKFDLDRQHDYPRTGRDVTIKQGAWIASNSIILGPCIIGEHSVVAAGALVKEDVPPYTIVAGIPAREVRRIIPCSSSKVCKSV